VQCVQCTMSASVCVVFFVCVECGINSNNQQQQPATGYPRPGTQVRRGAGGGGGGGGYGVLVLGVGGTEARLAHDPATATTTELL
jgi:hypothetical protein